MFLRMRYETCFSSAFLCCCLSKSSISALQFYISAFEKAELEKPNSSQPLTPSAMPKLRSERKYASSLQSYTLQIVNTPVMRARGSVAYTDAEHLCKPSIPVAQENSSQTLPASESSTPLPKVPNVWNENLFFVRLDPRLDSG